MLRVTLGDVYTRIENMLYFFQQTMIGKHGKKTLGDTRFSFAAMRGTKKAFFENK